MTDPPTRRFTAGGFTSEFIMRIITLPVCGIRIELVTVNGETSGTITSDLKNNAEEILGDGE